MDKATIDFETRSACNIKKTGSWKYSLHPTTEVLCLAVHLPHYDDVELWHPAMPHLGIVEEGTACLRDVFYWILGGGLVEAHNAFFERGIWANILVHRFGWPAIPPHQWRCSAAKAAAHSLPRGLDDLASALSLRIRKDAEGHKLMMKMNKPRKPRKAEREAWAKAHGTAPMPLLWHETPEQLERLWDYCKQDVRTEVAASHAVPDLSESEQQMYLLDQTINQRGFLLDTRGVEAARRLIHSESTRLNTELSLLTGGNPNKATQRQKMQNWFADQWFVLNDTQAPTIETALQGDDLDPSVRRGLELLQMLGRASTAKYDAMWSWACPDGRVRGGLLYHGASTGRWSGVGVQPHNFPKGTVANIDGAWGVITAGNPDAIRAFKYNKKGEEVGDVLKLLSQALRGAIIASPGKKLFVADYAAIEARVLLWCADEEEALEIFRRGDDIYCDMASSIYHRPITANPSNPPPERALGKVAVLGLGYQMGATRFFDTCANFGIPITEALAEQTVAAYRAKYARVKQWWYDTEAAAISATRHPGESIRCGPVSWEADGQTLYCTLPSSRRLAYPSPRVKGVRTSWGANKVGLTHMGVNPLTRQWQRQTVYGGLLVENIVQAISRDIMAEAMVACEASGVYEPILSVHDELIAEANEHLGEVEEFVKLVARCPTWATGCPVAAEGWAGKRYRK